MLLGNLMMKINKGWFRLLIVISALWVFYMGGLMLFEYLSRNPFDQFPDGREPSEYFFWQWSSIDLLAPAAEQVRQFEPKLLKAVLWALGPIGLLWLLAWSVAWIRDGFKQA